MTDVITRTSFSALTPDQLDQLGTLLDIALGPDPTA